MKPRVRSATVVLQARGLLGPEVVAPSGNLLRPFLDLTGGDNGPINARVARYAGQDLASARADDPDWTPPQSNTRQSLRAALIRETGLTDYDVEWPGQLPDHLVTPQWSALIDAIGQWSRLSPPHAYHLVCALYKLGLFKAAVEIGGPPDPERASSDHAALTVLRVVSAMSKLGHDKRVLRRFTAAVYDVAPSGTRARLAAATNLCIHYARAARDPVAVELWASRVRVEAEHLRPAESPADGLRRSTALRAMAFWPFLRHDHTGTALMLEEAQEYAIAAMDDSAVPSAIARENMYAVLETRANAAVASGNREDALRFATALTRHDPVEPRAWLQLGDVHWDDGRIQDAMAAFRAASALGAPFTAVAWYCAARCAERLGDLHEACRCYAASVAADPLGITSLAGLGRVAARTGDAYMAEWARERLSDLRDRAAVCASRTAVPLGARA